jgi:hypothetical protein
MISNNDLKPVYSSFHSCEFCDKGSNGSYLLESFAYCETGLTRQKVMICTHCMNEYNQISMYMPNLVTADRFTNAEEIILDACKTAVAESKSNSPPDVFDLIGEMFYDYEDVKYYFDYKIENVNAGFRRLWRLRYQIWKLYKF